MRQHLCATTFPTSRSASVNLQSATYPCTVLVAPHMGGVIFTRVNRENQEHPTISYTTKEKEHGVVMVASGYQGNEIQDSRNYRKALGK